MVDIADLKSAAVEAYRFESGRGYQVFNPPLANGEQVVLYTINLDKVQDAVRFCNGGPDTL